MKKIIVVSGIIIIVVLVVFAISFFRKESNLIVKNIGSLDYKYSTFDIEGGCQSSGKICIAYAGDYADPANVSNTAKVIVEKYLWFVDNDYVQSQLSDQFGINNPAKIDLLGQKVLSGKDKYGLFIVSWNSGTRVVRVRSPYDFDHNASIKQLIGDYLAMHKSSLK